MTTHLQSHQPAEFQKGTAWYWCNFVVIQGSVRGMAWPWHAVALRSIRCTKTSSCWVLRMLHCISKLWRFCKVAYMNMCMEGNGYLPIEYLQRGQLAKSCKCAIWYRCDGVAIERSGNTTMNLAQLHRACQGTYSCIRFSSPTKAPLDTEVMVLLYNVLWQLQRDKQLQSMTLWQHTHSDVMLPSPVNAPVAIDVIPLYARFL